MFEEGFDIGSKESFRQDPFNKEQKTRLYKTGDIGRWLDDGNIEFVGRRDFQVKVNGFRIELEEIEARLLQFPTVKEVVVIDLLSGDSSKILVAYYTGITEIESQKLRSFLLEKLPHYMVPSLFVHLQTMPLNNSGKIDRKLLPKPGKKNSKTEEQGKISSNEKAIIEVWKKVLNLQQISVTDNFFEIGGDSIKSIQAVSMLREVGYKITVKDIFIYQTVEELAKKVSMDTKEIKVRSVKGIFPLSPIQENFFLQNFVNANYYHQAFCIDVKTIDKDILTNSFKLLLKRHVSLRLRFVRGKTISQHYIDEQPNILTFFDISEEKDILFNSEKIIKETCMAINVETGPLIKASLVYTNVGNKLIIAVHHLCIDFISWNFLLEDLENIYLHLKDSTHKLKSIRTSTYKDWIERLTEYSESETIQEYIPFWEEQLSHVENIFTEIKDSKDENRSIVRIKVNKEATKSIHNFSTLNSIKIENILLMITASAISQYSGSRIIPILIEKHGRVDLFDDLDISGSIGWFTSLFPIVLDFSSNQDPNDRLSVVESVFKSIPNDGVDYGVLRYMRKKNDAKKIRNANEPQIVFNFLGDITSNDQNNLFSKRTFLAENLLDPNNKLNKIENKIEIDIHQVDEDFILVPSPNNKRIIML